jgi:hypothetical protein
LVSAQLVHAAPPLPHWAALVAVALMHWVPVQQPVQQLLAKHLPVLLAQLVVSATALLLHTPLLQVSLAHSFESLHEAHAAPPLPHAVALAVPGWHVVPSQQPVQHAPSSHLPLPPAQLVPGATACVEHTPFAPQVGVRHSLVVVQAAHAPPPVPHAATVLPVRQDAPLAQPAQHTPLTHCPPGQAVVSKTFVVVHWPEELHAATLHELGEVHA